MATMAARLQLLPLSVEIFLISSMLCVQSKAHVPQRRMVSFDASGTLAIQKLQGDADHPSAVVLDSAPTKPLMRAEKPSSEMTASTASTNSRKKPKLEPKAKQKAPHEISQPKHMGLKKTANIEVLYSVGASNRPDRVPRLKAILDTWGSKLKPTQFLVVGHKPTASELPRASWDPAPDCTDTHSGGACKDFLGLVHAYFETDANWVILLGDDNYVVTKNMEEVLRFHDHTKPIAFGILGCGPVKECPTGMCGGGGQIFSRGALRNFLANGRDEFLNESHAIAQRQAMFGDITLCIHCVKKKVQYYNSLAGLHGWHLNKNEIDESMSSRVTKPLTYHYVKPKEMYYMHSVLNSHTSLYAISDHDSHNDTYLPKYLAARDAYVKSVNEERAKARSLPSFGSI
eukprot:TRINITY_DN6299_c0_g1_i1.p1 TRINITY_DN6299_c0_g1~~TRINITY_DN6299_c0_g1_i1.p1  ORF type:complete len:401 (+),score=61.04 TRINITY_DN6299_c0_g1_i1:70-1272(+)